MAEKRTISYMLGTGSLNHNSRKFSASNIDPERTRLNTEYCNENIRDVYEELFGEAVRKYNEKHRGGKSVINDYYDKVLRSKNQRTFYEIIVQIGDRNNMNSYTESGKTAEKILDEYYRGFQKRNHSLRVFSAHLHMDETTPHLHIDFIPYTSHSKWWLESRVSLKKALAELGFTGGTREITEWSMFVDSEKKIVADIMLKYGYEWEHLEMHEKHISILNYKRIAITKDIEKLEKEKAEKQAEINLLNRQLDIYHCGIKNIDRLSSELESKQEFSLPKADIFMSANGYRDSVARPVVQRLKKIVMQVLQDNIRKSSEIAHLSEANRILMERDLMQKEALKRNTELQLRINEATTKYSTLARYVGEKKLNAMLEEAKLEKSRNLSVTRSHEI